MNSSKVVSYSLLIVAIGIAVANAEKYTFIKNATIKKVNTSIQANKKAAEICTAEATAVWKALQSFEETQTKFAARGTLFISCSTGFNGIILVKGEAMRLKTLAVKNLNKPKVITVAYTYNYAHPDPEARKIEMGLFMQAVSELTAAAIPHGITVSPRKILVPVDALVPYYGGDSRLSEAKTYLEDQNKTIEDCKGEDSIPKTTSMSLREFKTEIVNAEVKMLYDGIVGSEPFPLETKTLLLTAIARAQISFMGLAINERPQRSSAALWVLSNDSPSGMDELGVWVALYDFRGYTVHLLITYGWNKELSNSMALATTQVRILNPDYDGTTFLGELEKIVDKLPERSDNLTRDITEASKIKDFIGFRFRPN